jgi:hypothetical protein
MTKEVTKEERVNDFSPEEETSLEEFRKAGRPGILSISDKNMSQWFALYMSGKSYSEIALISKSKRVLILHVSRTQNWATLKKAYFSDIQRVIIEEVKNTRIESVKFMTDLIRFIHKTYTDTMNDILATGDMSKLVNMDFKTLTYYFKAIEQLEKMLENTSNKIRKPTKDKDPVVNININAPSSLETGEDDINIKTTQGFGDTLKKLSDFKKDKTNDKK